MVLKEQQDSKDLLVPLVLKGILDHKDPKVLRDSRALRVSRVLKGLLVLKGQ